MARERLPDLSWKAGISSFEGQKAAVLAGDGWKLITREPGVWISAEHANKEILARFDIDEPSESDHDETLEPG